MKQYRGGGKLFDEVPLIHTVFAATNIIEEKINNKTVPCIRARILVINRPSATIKKLKIRGFFDRIYV